MIFVFIAAFLLFLLCQYHFLSSCSTHLHLFTVGNSVTRFSFESWVLFHGCCQHLFFSLCFWSSLNLVNLLFYFDQAPCVHLQHNPFHSLSHALLVVMQDANKWPSTCHRTRIIPSGVDISFSLLSLRLLCTANGDIWGLACVKTDL